MVTRLHLSHAIVVRLHVRKRNVVILTPETGVTVGVCEQQPILFGRILQTMDFEAMDVAWSTPQLVHYHADSIYLLPLLGIKKEARALWYSELSLHKLGLCTPMYNILLHSIPSV